MTKSDRAIANAYYPVRVFYASVLLLFMPRFRTMTVMLNIHGMLQLIHKSEVH